jgi:hypothetical protein
MFKPTISERTVNCSQQDAVPRSSALNFSCDMSWREADKRPARLKIDVLSPVPRPRSR